MLASPVWRGRTDQRKTLSVFAVGLMAGGAVTASALWVLSGLAAAIPTDWRTAMLITVAALALARDLRIVRFPLPQNARQIPQTVFHRGVVRAALQFGFELGSGVRTYLPATAPYVLAAAVLLGGEPFTTALLAGVSFGLGRALMPALRYSSGAGEVWDRRLTSRMPRIVPLASAAGVVAVCSLTLV